MPQPCGDLAPRSCQSLTPQRHFLLQERATPQPRESLTPLHWQSLAPQIHLQHLPPRWQAAPQPCQSLRSLHHALLLQLLRPQRHPISPAAGPTRYPGQHWQNLAHQGPT